MFILRELADILHKSWFVSERTTKSDEKVAKSFFPFQTKLDYDETTQEDFYSTAATRTL